MALNDLERQNRGFYGFFSRYEAAQVYIIHKEAPPSPTPHAYGRCVLWSRWAESKW